MILNYPFFLSFQVYFREGANLTATHSSTVSPQENSLPDYGPVISVNRLSELVLSLPKETRTPGVGGLGGLKPPATGFG
jgi:hypothetical protein